MSTVCKMAKFINKNRENTEFKREMTCKDLAKFSFGCADVAILPSQQDMPVKQAGVAIQDWTLIRRFLEWTK